MNYIVNSSAFSHVFYNVCTSKVNPILMNRVCIFARHELNGNRLFICLCEGEKFNQVTPIIYACILHFREKMKVIL